MERVRARMQKTGTFSIKAGAATHTNPNWIPSFRAVAPSGGPRWLQRRGPEAGCALLATHLFSGRSSLETSGFNKDILPTWQCSQRLSCLLIAEIWILARAMLSATCSQCSEKGQSRTVDFLCHAGSSALACVAGPSVSGAKKIVYRLACSKAERCTMALFGKSGVHLGATVWSQEPPEEPPMSRPRSPDEKKNNISSFLGTYCFRCASKAPSCCCRSDVTTLQEKCGEARSRSCRRRQAA